MKKKIIFVMSRMTIGGSQKSLINALRIIDYSKYDVTLYIRENKTDLISDVPKEVRVIVNTNPSDYEHRPYTLFLEGVRRMALIFHRDTLLARVNRNNTAYIARKKTEYERGHYAIFDEEYDSAISYLQGYTCKFTADVVKAKRFICFFHNSTDGTPDLHRDYLPKYDRTVFMAEKTRILFEEKYPAIKNKTTVIQNLIDVNDILKKSDAYNVEKSDSKIVLCTCGRISVEKGYDLAVDAAEILRQNQIAFKWYFIGDGPKRSEIEQKIREWNLEDEIVLLGTLDNPYPWLKSCDIYVQPSMEESQSLTIMEAIVLKKCVVSTKTVGGTGNIESGKTGVLVDFTGDSIAYGIMQLVNNIVLYNSILNHIKDKDYREYNDRIASQWNYLLEGTI